MTNPVWLLYVLMAILLWSATSLLYKAGAIGDKEDHICLKFSICVGMIFFVIALVYLITREEKITIWESAVRYWPMTLFGLVYAVVNTISFNGYVYNEATVESPVEGISGGMSTVLLVIAYLVLGRVDSVSELLSPLRTAGILVILISIILLSTIRNREGGEVARDQKAAWMRRGLGTLIFPVIFAVIDGLNYTAIFRAEHGLFQVPGIVMRVVIWYIYYVFLYALLAKYGRTADRKNEGFLLSVLQGKCDEKP